MAFVTAIQSQYDQTNTTKDYLNPQKSLNYLLSSDFNTLPVISAKCFVTSLRKKYYVKNKYQSGLFVLGVALTIAFRIKIVSPNVQMLKPGEDCNAATFQYTTGSFN